MSDLVTYITAVFGDGEHRFDIHGGGFKHLMELEEKTGEGPFVTFRRLYSGEWRVSDIREVLRLGLIGGGMEPAKAFRLVQRYFDGSPTGAHVGLAMNIMAAAIHGRDPSQPAPVEEVAEDDAA